MKLNENLIYVCRGTPIAVLGVVGSRPSHIWPFVEIAVPVSVHIGALETRVNEMGTAAVGLLTGCWPPTSGDIMTRGTPLSGPATL